MQHKSLVLSKVSGFEIYCRLNAEVYGFSMECSSDYVGKLGNCKPVLWSGCVRKYICCQNQPSTVARGPFQPTDLFRSKWGIAVAYRCGAQYCGALSSGRWPLVEAKTYQLRCSNYSGCGILPEAFMLPLLCTR